MKKKTFLKLNIPKKSRRNLQTCLLLLFFFLPALKLQAYGSDVLTYYLNVTDFVDSFIEIPSANVSSPSSTVSSEYLAGRAPVYDTNDIEVGTCSASFLCIQNNENIYNDISNYFTNIE